MTDLKVAELADEFSRRGLTRRQILTLGARLGLTSATLGAVLARTGHEAAAAGHSGRISASRALDDYIAKQTDFNLPDFTPQSLVSYKHEDKLWGIPYDEGPGNLYYNKDLFDKAEISYPDETWTLDKLKEVALKMTSGEGGDKLYGIGDLPSPGNALMAPPYLFPFGAQYLNEPDESECLINKPE